MNRALLLIFILLFSSPAFTEEPYEVPDEYMKKIMEQNRPAMEKYLEENPDIKKHYQKDLEAAGLIEPEEQTGKIEEAQEPPPVVEVKTIEEKEKFTGSRGEADEAFAKGDYETAMKHYKALAEEGDGEASLTLGIMYGDGLGVEKDKSESYAWMKRSADQGEHAAETLSSDMQKYGGMTEEEQARADERIREFSMGSAETVDGDLNTGQSSSLATIQSYTQKNQPHLTKPSSIAEPATMVIPDLDDWKWRPEKTVSLIRLQKSVGGTYSWAPDKLNWGSHFTPERFMRSM